METQDINISETSNNNNNKKGRSEALIRAQEKYYNKIKQDNNDIWQKLKANSRKRSKERYEKIKQDPNLYEKEKEKNRRYAKKWYYSGENRSIISVKRHNILKLKKENKLNNLEEVNDDEFNDLLKNMKINL